MYVTVRNAPAISICANNNIVCDTFSTKTENDPESEEQVAWIDCEVLNATASQDLHTQPVLSNASTSHAGRK